MQLARTVHARRGSPAAHAAVALAAALLLVGCGAADDGSAGPGSPVAPSSDARTRRTVVASSASTAEAPDGTTLVAEGGDLPDGVYRVELTPEHLAAHGLSPDDVAFNVGVWTTTLEDGRWTVDQVAPGVTDHAEGAYQVDGEDLYWRFHDTLQVLHVRWSTGEQGELRFDQVTDTGPYEDFQFALPWVRVS